MQNLIDFASERVRRQDLSRQVSEGADRFASELHCAGVSLANLAWTLAAPVRDRDQNLTLGIYKLVLTRLSDIVSGAIAEFDQPSEIKWQMSEQAEDVAYSAFHSQMLIFLAADLYR